MIKERLSKLRDLMKKYNITVYLIPGVDPHQSEYLPELWKRRHWISGFTGSAGDVVVTLDKAGLWTDSRYFLQAEEQFKGSTIDLFKVGLPETPSIEKWLYDNLTENDVIGFDPYLMTFSYFNELKSILDKKNIKLKSIDENLVDIIWTDQPDLPSDKVYLHDIKYSGESTQDKIKKIQKKLEELNQDVHIISSLDSIAWLYNIRSNDILYTPVVISYAAIEKDNAKLFVKLSKIDEATKKELGKDIQLYDYYEFSNYLKEINQKKLNVFLDKATATYKMVETLQNCNLYFAESPIVLFKAIKNDIQIEGFKNSHIRDGVAMVKFLYWLKNNIEKEKITEISASEKLKEFRAQQELFVDLSFETIAGYKEHGAIVHYTSSKETDVELKREGIFLIDSGGQYLDGTTDITRTIALGEPTSEQKKMFTLVLKGHIDLAITSFPVGTVGKQLDTIARKPLWDNGLNYGHGTGHGVGHFLGVHEGPHAISFYRCKGDALVPGMITSNEPGFYKAGEYGIRIENLVYVTEDRDKSSDEFKFYKFENLTMCPIDLNLIDKSLLNKEEIDYLNKYHKEVYEKLSPFLNEEEKNWLKEKTRAI